MSFDEIEFQLKYHIMERAILAKEHEVQTLQARLQSVGAIKIQSEDSILQIIGEVHKTMKGISKIVVQLKDPFCQLKINSFYEMFKNICCVMIGAVRILAQGCQNGVERNLLKFTQKDDNKKVQIYQTLCLQQKIEELKKKEQQNKRLSKKQQYYNDVRTKMEIDRIYESVLTEKQSVRRITASNAVNKLNQVRMDWIKMINDSDKILQQAYSRKNQGEKQNFAQKLHRPEYITKVLKEELSNSIKNYFKQSVQKIIKKLYSEFYVFEYNKLKADLLKNKPVTNDQYQQTDIEGMSAIKQIAREKKNYEKLAKQLQNLQHEKNDLVEQYIKATRNNELYVNRIQELQRKLISIIPVKNLQKKLSQARKSIRESRRNSSRGSIREIEDDKSIDKMRNQSKFGNGVNPIMAYTQQGRSQTNENQLIIKKRAKLKRIYTKSRMHTQNFQSSKKQEQIPYNMTSLEQKLTMGKLEQISTQQPINNPIKQLANMQDGGISSLDQPKENMNIAHQVQFRSLIMKVIQLIKKFSLAPLADVNKQQNPAEEKQMNTITNRYTQILEQNRANKADLKIVPNAQLSQINQNLDKIILNSQISTIFQNLVKKIVLVNNVKKKDTFNINKQTIEDKECNDQNLISPSLNQQGMVLVSLNNRQVKNNNVRQSIKTDHADKQSAMSQRFSKTRKLQLSGNFIQNIFNLKGKKIEQISNRQSDDSKNERSSIKQSSSRAKTQQKQKLATDNHKDPNVKTITEFDEQQNFDNFKIEDVKSAKFNNQFLKERFMKDIKQNVVNSILYNHKRVQSDNPNMFLTVPAQLSTQNKEINHHYELMSTKRFDKIDFQHEKSKTRQSKRKEQGILALKNLNQNISKMNAKISNNEDKSRLNDTKQQKKSQNRLFSIQKLRPSTKQEQKRLPHQQTIIKDIVSICKNYKSSNLNLESMISQYIRTAIHQLKSNNLYDKSH